MPRLTARAKQALIEERRGQILEAAARVFSAHGYEGATIRQIARRARLAEGTVYLYFPSKRDLLLATWEHLAVSPLFPLLDQVQRGANDEEFFTAVLANRFTLIQHQAAFFRLVLQQADVDPPLRRALQRRLQTIKKVARGLLHRRMTEGAFRRLSIPIVMRAFAGMMMGMPLLEAYDPDPVFKRFPIDRIAGAVAHLLLHGLIAEGGQQQSQAQGSSKGAVS